MLIRVMCGDNATECTGLWFFTWGLAALGGPGIVGPLFDKYHSYRYKLIGIVTTGLGFTGSSNTLIYETNSERRAFFSFRGGYALVGGIGAVGVMLIPISYMIFKRRQHQDKA